MNNSNCNKHIKFMKKYILPRAKAKTKKNQTASNAADGGWNRW